MPFTSATRIGDVVLEVPEAMRLFESIKLDYCCGGQRGLGEACAQAGLDVRAVLDRLAALREAPAEPDRRDWQGASLVELIAHLESTHHAFTRDELNRLAPLMVKVLGAHGANHSELARIAALLHDLTQELLPHLEKEERVLFPYIRILEGGGEGLGACCGSVRGPIQVMLAEHDRAGEVLREMRELARDYAAPEDACGSFRSLYLGLAGLEADLHRHIHLENNLLFPRAAALEAAGAR